MCIKAHVAQCPKGVQTFALSRNNIILDRIGFLPAGGVIKGT